MELVQADGVDPEGAQAGLAGLAQVLGALVEAPSAARLDDEMRGFVDWFNSDANIEPVLKAALAAASAPGPPETRSIHQQHLEEAMRDVLESKHVMRQTIATRAMTPAVATTTMATVLSACAILIAILALLMAVR